MASNFCLTVRFLQPYYHGRSDGGAPEWPPSPLRMFQSLVAAAASRWREAAFRDDAAPALRWLEQLPAPSIVAPVGVPAKSKYRLYVPDNVADKVASSWTAGRDASIADYRTEKDVRPTHLSDEAVHYLFQLPDRGCPHLDILTSAARSITHLGWGVDMVAANASILSAEEAANLLGEHWHAVEGAAATDYRVPMAGTLDDLLQKHQAFLTRIGPDGFRPVPPLSAFRIAGYRKTTDVPGRPHVAFRLLHPSEERPAWFAATRANCVAAMTRHATAVAAQRKSQAWVDSYVHGHRTNGDDAKPRFSYLPLPTIEHRSPSSRVVSGIRRVMLAELTDAAESHLSWVRQMMPGQFLVDESSSERKAMLVPLDESDWVLRQYSRSSDTWASVTPVVLPGSDEGKPAKAEKLFAKALAHAGYGADALAELDFRNVSFWQGGDLSLRFQRPNYLRNGHWSVYHVRLRWRQPIKGPVAIGAGRHCGLGIFAACADS